MFICFTHPAPFFAQAWLFKISLKNEIELQIVILHNWSQLKSSNYARKDNVALLFYLLNNKIY